jgi:hypothetical protein
LCFLQNQQFLLGRSHCAHAPRAARNPARLLHTPNRNTLMKLQINWLIVIVIKRIKLREGTDITSCIRSHRQHEHSPKSVQTCYELVSRDAFLIRRLKHRKMALSLCNRAERYLCYTLHPRQPLINKRQVGPMFVRLYPCGEGRCAMALLSQQSTRVSSQ